MLDSATTCNELEFVRLHTDDIPECVDIARRSFGQFKADAEPVRHWFNARILHNPWQGALDGIGVGLRVRSKLVAFRAMCAQPWWIEGQSTVMAFAAHTSMEPAYRGNGLGSHLIAESRDMAELTGSATAGNITQKVYGKQGFVAIGAHSNDFFRLRASYVGSTQSRLGPALGRVVGSVLDALSSGSDHGLGLAPGFSIEAVSSCSSEFDELWAHARGGYASCLERSSRYLNWRLFEQPTCPLSLLALRDGRNRLRGYGVWHELRYSKLVSCAVLRDLFVSSDDDEALRAFMVHAIRYWRCLGITWVNLEVAAERMTHLFEAQGYERLPSKGNRYHVHSRRGLGPSTVNGWLRSGLDGDYFDTRTPPQ